MYAQLQVNSSRDTLLDLEPMPASVLKLAVATVLTVAAMHDCNFFPQLHSVTMQFLLNAVAPVLAIKPLGQLYTILLPIIPFLPIFSNYYQFLRPPISLKIIPE